MVFTTCSLISFLICSATMVPVIEGATVVTSNKQTKLRSLVLKNLANHTFPLARYGSSNNDNSKQTISSLIQVFQPMIRKKAERHVARMDMGNLLASNACPRAMTASMCQQIKANPTFYLWLKEARRQALVEELVESESSFIF